VAAFWEIYIHEGFRRAGFRLTFHPDVAGTTKRPDFLVEGHGLSCFIECVVSGDADEITASEQRRRQIYDEVNRFENQDFFLNLQIEH
jgi:hypothetical protein